MKLRFSLLGSSSSSHSHDTHRVDVKERMLYKSTDCFEAAEKSVQREESQNQGEGIR